MPKRVQINVNFPRPAEDAFRRTRIHAGISNTRLGLTAYAAWTMTDPAVQEQLLALVKLVDEKQMDWAEVEKCAAAESKTRARLYRELVEEALTRALGARDTPLPTRVTGRKAK